MVDTTETLEPIVNNSPKELPVPQFNADEVCKVVQDGIDHAKILLPAAESGTKLYKHVLKFSGGTPNKYLTIITAKSSAYTDKTSVQNDEKIINMFYGKGQNNPLIVTYIISSEYGLQCEFFNYSSSTKTSQNYFTDTVSFIDDTVAEL